jgi:hypothetical protein
MRRSIYAKTSKPHGQKASASSIELTSDRPIGPSPTTQERSAEFSLQLETMRIWFAFQASNRSRQVTHDRQQDRCLLFATKLSRIYSRRKEGHTSADSRDAHDTYHRLIVVSQMAAGRRRTRLLAATRAGIAFKAAFGKRADRHGNIQAGVA